jgi:hypothetical protein
MTTYAPNAIAIDHWGRPVKLFTCYPYFSKTECHRQVALWGDKRVYAYRLLCSWVEVTHDSGAKRIIAMHTYRENF